MAQRATLLNSGEKIDACGSRVAFVSFSAMGDSRDSNLDEDVYVKDLQTGALTLASITPDGSAAGFSGNPALSGDGTTVVFNTSAPPPIGQPAGGRQIVRVVLGLGGTELLTQRDGSVGDGDSRFPALSTDGTVVTFYTTALNLVPGAVPGQSTQIVVHRAEADPWQAPLPGGSYHGVAPSRLLDSRSGVGLPAPGVIRAGTPLRLTVAGRASVPASGVGAVVLNLTVTQSSGGGYVTG